MIHIIRTRDLTLNRDGEKKKPTVVESVVFYSNNVTLKINSSQNVNLELRALREILVYRIPQFCMWLVPLMGVWYTDLLSLFMKKVSPH